MARIFLTGGTGFIGAEVAKAALAQGHDVALYDLAAPHFEGHESFWIRGDVRDRDVLERAVRSFAPDHIVHLASDTDVSVVRMDQFTTTLDGTRNIIAIVKTTPGLAKFVHVSTQFVVRPGVSPSSEEHFDPYTVYGEAKAETEKMVRSANIEAPWLIVRPTIIWGPHHPSFADHIFKHIGKRTYLHPTSRRPIMRAFGYVANTAAQILALALRPETPGGRRVFYAGDGAMDYQAWADAFSTGLTGKRARRVPVGVLTALGRLGDIAKRLHLPAPIDSGRAFRMSTSSAIDLQPTIDAVGGPDVTFERGVRETLEWLDGGSRKPSSSAIRPKS